MDQLADEFDRWIHDEQLESRRDVIPSALGSNLVELKQVSDADIANAFKPAGARKLVLNAIRRLPGNNISMSHQTGGDSSGTAAAATTANSAAPIDLPAAIDLSNDGMQAAQTGDHWSESTFLLMPGSISIRTKVLDQTKFGMVCRTPFEPRPGRSYNDEGDFPCIATQLVNVTQLSSMVGDSTLTMAEADRSVVHSLCSLMNVQPLTTKDPKEACNDGNVRARPLIRVYPWSRSAGTELELRLFVYISKTLQNILADRATKEVFTRLDIPPPPRQTEHKKSREHKTWKLPAASRDDETLLSAAYTSMVCHGYTGHHALSSRIDGLELELLEFQKQTVSWMCDREDTNLHDFFFLSSKQGRLLSSTFQPSASSLLPNHPRHTVGFWQRKWGLAKQ